MWHPEELLQAVVQKEHQGQPPWEQHHVPRYRHGYHYTSGH